ncbi:MAG: aminotransferase class IV [Breznakibacter sp.]
MANHIIFNGIIISTEDNPINPSNRAFRYGDGVFDTLVCSGTEPLLFEGHYQRLLSAAVLLKFNIIGYPSLENFKKQIALLVAKNKYAPYSRIRITMYRSPGGLYTPEDNAPHWIIEQEPLLTEPFELNSKGLLTGIYLDMAKQNSPLSQFKTCSSLFFVLAGLVKKENGWGDILVTNQEGRIIEGLSSNLFWIKENKIFTPLVSSGCVDGIMRREVIRLSHDLGFPVMETRGATLNELLEADELFLTNSTQGIRWIVGLNDQRYYLKITRQLAMNLKKSLLAP